ncbi:hydrogenase iron-sulfur subunit [Halarsenatibacter silvermanii]|uniref:Coenzyme F420-reducing hydrogenase, delta subunit n=1 Tax=Halarsenatibacter silvermanii TaxID=321763 RepID=A0A1G9I462_9FIRM|nr:hydrogenase iron-sulfur subunit [Halarsenatibacter silvermanii]SDL19835.1 Coenzyme F420-reducing hydrogenase, delta subunit [Halarsenatibacter silvermanii]
MEAKAETEAAADNQKDREEFEPKIVSFLCNWCSYAAADLAGSSRLQYPSNIRTVRIPCTGRINPLLIIKTLEKGADGILVSGCHPGDCHYIDGNYYARRRFTMLKEMLEFAGVEPERLNFTWCSAAEGKRFAEIVTRVVDRVKSVGAWEGFIDDSQITEEDRVGEIDYEQFL